MKTLRMVETITKNGVTREHFWDLPLSTITSYELMFKGMCYGFKKTETGRIWTFDHGPHLYGQFEITG